MKIKGLHFCSFNPFEDNIRFRQHNNPFISFPSKPITIDNSGQFNTFNSATSTSITSFTIGNNNNRILLVGLLFNGSKTPSAITFNSVSMTLLQTETNATIGANMHLYYLIAPDITTASISVSWSGSSTGGIIAWSYYNVKQTSTFGTPAGFATHDASEASPIDVTQAVITTVANSLVVGVGTMIGGIGGNTITLTAYAGNTQRLAATLSIGTNWVMNCFDILAPSPASTTGGYHAAWGANQTQDKGIIVCEMLQA